jgi:hypothetical protein
MPAWCVRGPHLRSLAHWKLDDPGVGSALIIGEPKQCGKSLTILLVRIIVENSENSYLPSGGKKKPTVGQTPRFQINISPDIAK